MLMEILGIILAFSTVMMLFGLLVTSAVQFVQSIGSWREKILAACLEQFTLHLQNQLNGGKNLLKSTAKELLEPVSLNSGTNSFFGRKYQHTNVRKEQIQEFFEESIERGSIIAADKKDQLLKKHETLLYQKFDQFEQEMATMFTRKTHFLSFIFASIIAVAFQLNTFDLLSRLSMDEGYKKQLVQVAESTVEKNLGPCKSMGSALTFKQKSDKSISDLLTNNKEKPLLEKIYTLKNTSNTNFDELANSVNTIFGPESQESKQVFEKLQTSIDTQTLQNKKMGRRVFCIKFTIIE